MNAAARAFIALGLGLLFIALLAIFAEVDPLRAWLTRPVTQASIGDVLTVVLIGAFVARS